VTEPPPETLALTSELDRLGEARAWVAAHAAAAGFDDRSVLDLELVVTEAVSNVVRHAYGGEAGRPIELGFASGESEVRIRLRDWGGPFLDGRRARDDGGYGLGLIDDLVDAVERTALDDGNVLELTKRRPGGRP
jgi:serine/threonine-protein kinase RsbW